MTKEKGKNHLKDQLFHGLRHNICNCYMYDKPGSQYSQLVMGARKAETERPGSGVSQVRAKSAVVQIESQSKLASSNPPYEAIMQQITYLMSTITNQNANNNGQNGPRYYNGNGRFPNARTQRPKKDRKDMICSGCRGTRHRWRGCSTCRQGNNLPFKPANQNLDGQWGGNTDLQSSPNPDQAGVNISGQLRKAGVFMGLDYHNPKPWLRLLSRANESEIEIDWIKNKPLINSGAMISMMSKEYCDKHGYEIQPLGLTSSNRRQWRGRCPLFGLH